MGKLSEYARRFGLKFSHFGSNTNGHDVKAFGDTTGKYVEWDASADTLDVEGTLKLNTVALTATATQINKEAARYVVTSRNGAAGQKVCSTNGITSIVGGTGIADMTLAAPSPGDVAIIRIASISSGSVVVTCGTGVKIDGTSLNTITFDAANEQIMLAYESATKWVTVANIGGVALSTV
jgi:hypothetical protein